jgi:hypothetical protein
MQDTKKKKNTIGIDLDPDKIVVKSGRISLNILWSEFG